MEAEITARELYWNQGLRNFFMREQATEEFENLVNRATVDNDEVFDAIDTHFNSLDDFEECCYDWDAEEMADYIGIELDEEDDEEDED